MAKIILDAGSGNTCRNDWNYTKRMLDELKKVDSGKHEVIIKWQLFKEAGDNIPLDRTIFEMAYVYAQQLGYKTTSSVFDKESLDFLLQFDVPFVKIANRRELDWLIGKIPREIPIYVSVGSQDEYRLVDNGGETEYFGDNIIQLCCISSYPATLQEYEDKFLYKQLFLPENKWETGFLNNAVSDHTTDFELWHKYQPEIIEMHYGLPDSTGFDAGPFMRTPEMLREVL
ncbi:MAG: N-acetylneuraminate synthase family protein [Thermodesulfovibrionales bacterium]|jgi:sialic acid synthase SpsE